MHDFEVRQQLLLRLMDDADAAGSISDLMTRCVKRLHIRGWGPSLLTCVAHSVYCRAYLVISEGTEDYLEDISGNPNLDTLVLSCWDSRLAVHQRALFNRVMKDGRVKLRLYGDAVKDPSLGNLILATTCKVELMVADALSAYVARRTVDFVSASRNAVADRVTIAYTDDEVRRSLEDVPLADLAAKVAEEEDPAVCAYFGIAS